MFVCKDCLEGKAAHLAKLPRSFIKSRGPCEMCGYQAICEDVFIH